jgi:predicted branched-subunit amino acid permease
MFSRERVEECTRGIDFAMTALFIVILVDQMKSRENRASALIGLAASGLVFLSISAFSGFAAAKSGMLIPTMALIVCTFLALRGRLDPERRRGGAAA